MIYPVFSLQLPKVRKFYVAVKVVLSQFAQRLVHDLGERWYRHIEVLPVFLVPRKPCFLGRILKDKFISRILD